MTGVRLASTMVHLGVRGVPRKDVGSVLCRNVPFRLMGRVATAKFGVGSRKSLGWQARQPALAGCRHGASVKRFECHALLITRRGRASQGAL